MRKIARVSNAGGFDSDFYDAWAREQLQDPNREIVQQWKAIHLANLFMGNFPGERPRSICEVGGAEGTVLSIVGGLLGAEKQFNYEPSEQFRDAGLKMHPHIQFLQKLFNAEGDRYDVVILSDIIEHVQDQAALLKDVGARCGYVLIKMPVEKCISLSPAGFLLRGTRRPPELTFGPGHYNGHLRGYTVRSALSSVRVHLTVVDWFAIDHSFYYRGSKLFSLLRRWMGLSALMRIFGGSLFVLGRAKC